MFIIGILVKMYIDCGLFLFFLDFNIISWGEGIDVYYTTMCKDLVVDKRREFLKYFNKKVSLHHHPGGILCDTW